MFIKIKKIKKNSLFLKSKTLLFVVVVVGVFILLVVVNYHLRRPVPLGLERVMVNVVVPTLEIR